MYKLVDYKQTAKPRIDSSAVHIEPKVSPTEVKLATNDVKRFKKVRAKVDTSDPAPWAHHQVHSIEELVDREGLRANVRISGMVKSHSFGSQREMQEVLDSETERLFQRIVGKSKREANDSVAATDDQKKPDPGTTSLRVEDVEPDVEGLHISDDEDDHPEEDKGDEEQPQCVSESMASDI